MRNIDPATLRDDWYIAQTSAVRLFWLSLILAADDQGRFAANPALVRSQIFPADDISLAEVEGLMQAVSGKVRFYEANDLRYGQILNWWKYQGGAAWMGPSRFPPPEGWSDRYRYHAKGNKIVQSANWSEAPGPLQDELVEGKAQGSASSSSSEPPAEPGSPLGSLLGSALPGDGGRNEVEDEGDGDGEGESEGETARASPRGAAPSLSRSFFLDQDPGKGTARDLLLKAAGLASLPPTEYPRVEQVRAMITAYGAEKTLDELRRQREKWCRTRGLNGRLYSPLNMGWVDRADEALSGNGPPPEPERPIPEPPPIFTAAVPMPPDLPRPVIKPLPRLSDLKPAAQPDHDGQ